MTAMSPCSLASMNVNYICPVCGETAIKKQNAIGANWNLTLGKHNPGPGDLCMCVRCAELLQFDEAMDLVMPSLETLMHLSPWQSHMIETSSKRIKEGKMTMPKPELGNRVGAILTACLQSGVVHFIGYGKYVGDEVPPPEINPALNTGLPNPKLVMDDGQVVWGCECWWGPEEDMQDIVSKFKKVIPVNMQKERAKLNEKPNENEGDSQKAAGEDKPSPADGDSATEWKWVR